VFVSKSTNTPVLKGKVIIQITNAIYLLSKPIQQIQKTGDFGHIMNGKSRSSCDRNPV